MKRRRPLLRLHDYGDLMERLDDDVFFRSGELTAELEKRLDEINSGANTKIEHIGLFVLEQLLIADAIQVEEQRLAERRRVQVRKADRLKTYLQEQMIRLGISRVEGTLCTVTLQKNALPSVLSVPTDGDQGNLFARNRRAAHQSATVRGTHVRVR